MIQGYNLAAFTNCSVQGCRSSCNVPLNGETWHPRPLQRSSNGSQQKWNQSTLPMCTNRMGQSHPYIMPGFPTSIGLPTLLLYKSGFGLCYLVLEHVRVGESSDAFRSPRTEYRLSNRRQSSIRCQCVRSKDATF